MRIHHWLVVVAVLILGCKTEVKTQDSCGDDFRDPGEACDGSDLGGQDCVSLGFHANVGAPVCTAGCEFDTSSCGARCGDNTVDVAHDEECDSQQLSGNTCLTLGFTRGALACGADCRYDTSGCSSVCGDGVADSGEACDGTDLQGQTCEALGYHGGAIACAADCTLDLSPCEQAGRCGDGFLNGPESCDGDSFPPSADCGTEGRFSGSLLCNADCEMELAGCHGAVALSTGQSHACVLDDQGLAYCWGAGGSGRLGDGGTANRDLPVPVVMPPGVVFSAISAGTAHTCALGTDGLAYCWGIGYAGRLGNGTVANQLLPTPVTMPTGRTFTAIAAGDAHTCAIDDQGNGWCWGAGSTGQLGNGQTMIEANVPSAVTMPSATTFRAITAGYGHTCAITNTTAIRCWGLNNMGQVGNGTTDNLSTPAGIADGGVRGYIDVHAGFSTTCAVAADGVPYCWGQNHRGQVGDGTTDSPRQSPVAVLMPGGITSVKIATYLIHSCTVSTSGELYCWGGGEDGELGLGSTTTATVAPRQVTSLPPGVFLVDAHSMGSCALTGAGRPWCWGSNEHGQLGVGLQVPGPFFEAVPVASP